MAEAASDKAVGGKTGAGIAGYAQGLLCGGLIALLPGPSLLVGVLTAPGLVALLVDRSPERGMARAVLLFGACGAIGPVRAAYGAAGTLDPPLALALGWLTLAPVATAWSCAALGWVLAEAAPMVARLLMEAQARRAAARLIAERDALAAEWTLAQE